MDDYKPNSYKSRQENPEAVDDIPESLGIKARFRKRGVFQRIIDSMIVEDPKKALINYVIFEIQSKLPSALKEISEIVLDPDGISSRSAKKKRSSKISYKDYWDYQDEDDYYERKSSSTKSKSVLDFDEPILDSRGEAEELWETMTDIIQTKKQVSIAVMYALSGHKDGVSHTYYKYGWKKLPEKPSIIHVKEGYWLKLPRPVQLD